MPVVDTGLKAVINLVADGMQQFRHWVEDLKRIPSVCLSQPREDLKLGTEVLTNVKRL